jgi:hypothetical protein
LYRKITINDNEASEFSGGVGNELGEKISTIEFNILKLMVKFHRRYSDLMGLL